MSEVNCITGHVRIKFTAELLMKREMRKDKMTIRKLTTNSVKINKVGGNQQAFLRDWLAEIPASTVKKMERYQMVKKVTKEKLGTAVRKYGAGIAY